MCSSDLYAALLRQDPAAYRGLYHWQVHMISSAGDLWLPEGLELRHPEAVAVFLKRYPRSAPPKAAAPGAAAAAKPSSAGLTSAVLAEPEPSAAVPRPAVHSGPGVSPGRPTVAGSQGAP